MAKFETLALQNTTPGAQVDHDHLLMDAQSDPITSNRDLTRNMEYVYDMAKMIPTAIAGFAYPGPASAGALKGLSSYDAALATARPGTVGLGLAGTFAGEFAMDRLFFNDQPIRGGTLLGDVGGTVAALALPVPWTVKVPIMLAAHLGGKLIDKYAS